MNELFLFKDTYDMKSFDFWGFKKAIFNTLFQAAKALGGGILALKGQLVKVKGHLISTKGKIVTSGGEGIYNFGKSIAANAVMNVVKPASYTAPSAGTNHLLFHYKYLFFCSK